jgi:hypothetical protein
MSYHDKHVRHEGPGLTAERLDAIEREQTRCVRRDPMTDTYVIVSGVKSAQEKREQHAREAPLCADAAVFWERAGNKKNAAECRTLAAFHLAQSNLGQLPVKLITT